MAMDRHDKEMSSIVISLYSDVISPACISQRFFMLLESAYDLAFDILNAVDILALLIAHSVIDDIVPPAFLKRAKKHFLGCLKGTCLKGFSWFK